MFKGAIGLAHYFVIGYSTHVSVVKVQHANLEDVDLT